MTREEIKSMDLKWWQKEDLFDLIKDYPEVEIATREQLEKFRSDKYWEAQALIDQANSIESVADTIQLYLDLMEDK